MSTLLDHIGLAIDPARHGPTSYPGIPTASLLSAITTVKAKRHPKNSSVVAAHPCLPKPPIAANPVKMRNDRNILPTKVQKQLAACDGSDPNAVAGQPLSEYAPLVVSTNRWTPITLIAEAVVHPDSPEYVDRKVKGLLNKLTIQNFESISDQVLAWANKSEMERDGRTLRQVTKLIFEHAIDDETWSDMYARLCRIMRERVSGMVQDDQVKDAGGKPVTGGQLFQKYLLNRSQEHLERRMANWISPVSAAEEGRAAMALNGKQSAVALYSDEYYAVRTAKRQGLGFIRFLGELLKTQMLTERCMHDCIKRFLGSVQQPGEAQIECLCKALTTCGSVLDTPKARTYMDAYYRRIEELAKNPSVGSRIRFMLLVNCQYIPPTLTSSRSSSGYD